MATTEFIEAAEAQSTALGYDTAMLFVPHPIQDRTDDEIRAIADDAYERVIAMLTRRN